MSVSNIIKGACEQSGGSYRDGACRCADGSLRNINTGECVKESDAPLVPIDFNRESERREMADVDASPRLIGSRERIAVTTREELSARLQAGREVATGGPAIASPKARSPQQQQQQQQLVERERARLDMEAAAGSATALVERALRRPLSADGKAVGSGDVGAQEQAGDAPKIPPGLILAGLSFLLFRS